jgi:hypothetical protein
MSRAGDASSDGADQMQQRIQIARRDAEALKDRIKRKKDELADTTCKSTDHIFRQALEMNAR